MNEINLTVLYLILNLFGLGLIYLKERRALAGQYIVSPMGIFSLFYLLHVIIPFSLISFNTRFVIGFGYLNYGNMSDLIQTITVFSLFLAGAVVGTFSRSDIFRRNITILKVNGVQLAFFIAVLCSFFAAISIDISRSVEARSTILNSSRGTISFVGTYFFIGAIAYLALQSIASQRLVRFIVLTALIGIVSLSLGGRDFLLIHLVCSLALYLRVNQITNWLLIIAVIVFLFFIGSILDIFISLLRFGYVHDLKSFSFDAVDFFIFSRGFNAFQNLFVVLSDPFIEFDIKYLLFGVNDKFMENYFPLVAARGYGYPIGLVGEIYLSGSMWLVAPMGVGFGILGTSLNRVFVSSDNPLPVYLSVLSAFWLLSVGSNLFDNLLKTAAALAPYVVFLFFSAPRNLINGN